MQNDVLFNRVMNKTILITLEWALTDPDDPLSGAFTFKYASAGPLALKTMLPPAYVIIQVVDADGTIQGYIYAQGIFFNPDGTEVMINTSDISIKGTFATDSWEVYTE